jgi:2,4-dienoyl-CoA reductase-like NADH-dependent reductase (Old Yellow Enzyme family)
MEQLTMETKTLPTFLKPYRFNNGVVAKNRIMLAPMTNSQSHEDGTLSDEEFNWLKLRAQGGFGTLITAGAAPSFGSIGYPGQLATYDDRHIEGLHRLAEMADDEGALSVVQLMHAGMRAPASLNAGQQPTAPSVVHLDFPGFEDPRELSDEEILQIKKDFVESAVRAHKAGATGVELHAANGYLFTQFLSSVTNKRVDRWGGSNQNRARFLLETLKETRAVVPTDFTIGVRLLAEDSPSQKGFDIDETLEVIGWMNAIDYNYLHLSSGNARAKTWKYPEESKTNIRRFRDALRSDIALVASGGITTREDAEFALKEGADFVAVAKAAIAAPDWPKRVLDPAFKVPQFPMTVAQLADVGVTSKFIGFLTSMPFGIVANQ